MSRLGFDKNRSGKDQLEVGSAMKEESTMQGETMGSKTMSGSLVVEQIETWRLCGHIPET